MRKTIFLLFILAVSLAQSVTNCYGQTYTDTQLDSLTNKRVPGTLPTTSATNAGLNPYLKTILHNKINPLNGIIEYDSTQTYTPGRWVSYQGRLWLSVDSVSIRTFPSEGSDAPWDCRTCVDSPTDPDLTPFARKDGFAGLMKLNVEDYQGFIWDLRPDVASPSGNYLRVKPDTAWWDARYGGGAGSGGHTIRFNNANLPQRTTLQLEGYGVSVSDSVNKTKVTFANPFATLPNSNNIYVAVTGDDATGERGNISKPFANIAAAKAVYLTNDVINVNAGIFTGQASLEISGVNVQYNFSQGADVTFTDYLLASPNANVTIRGKGIFRASHYLVFNSGVAIDIEFDLMTFSTYFWSRQSNTTRLKGRRIDMTSNQFFAIQLTTLGTVEVETINLPTAASIVYVNDNTQLDFYNTHIAGVAELDMYDSPATHTRYNLISFYNSRLDLTHITTATGTGTTNSFYGRASFINTDIHTSLDGFYFQKTQAASEFVFDRASITVADPTTYHAFNRPSSGFGTQALPVKIRVLTGGLMVNATTIGDVTNLNAYTTPIFQPADTTLPAASLSPILGIKLKGAPVLVTGEGTLGQVPKANGDGTATWGTVSGGSGGGNPDSLASHPAAYYLNRANHTGTQAWSTITSTPTTLAGYGITDGAGGTTTNALTASTGLEFISGSNFDGSAARALRLASGAAVTSLGFTPVSNVLSSANFIVGNVSNVASPVTMSGHGSLSNTGVLTVSGIPESAVTNLTNDLAAKVPTTTTVNGHALSSNATVTTSGTTNRVTVTNGTTDPTIDISSTYVGQSSITTLGTVTTGGWNGTVISPTYGGTGINNGSSTITLGGNLTLSGAFATTITVTGTTGVTLPTSGTLYGTASGSITSSQFVTSLTDETGTGVAVFATSPTLTNPVVGTQSASDNSTKAASTAYVDAADALKAPLSLTINDQTASYTLVLGDAGKLIRMNVATANNITIPLNSSVAFPIGTQITVSNTGAGQVTFVATGGVTLNSADGALKLRVQFSAATFIKTGSDTWLLTGDITL